MPINTPFNYDPDYWQEGDLVYWERDITKIYRLDFNPSTEEMDIYNHENNTYVGTLGICNEPIHKISVNAMIFLSMKHGEPAVKATIEQYQQMGKRLCDKDFEFDFGERIETKLKEENIREDLMDILKNKIIPSSKEDIEAFEKKMYDFLKFNVVDNHKEGLNLFQRKMMSELSDHIPFFRKHINKFDENSFSKHREYLNYTETEDGKERIKHIDAELFKEKLKELRKAEDIIICTELFNLQFIKKITEDSVPILAEVFNTPEELHKDRDYIDMSKIKIITGITSIASIPIYIASDSTYHKYIKPLPEDCVDKLFVAQPPSAY